MSKYTDLKSVSLDLFHRHVTREHYDVARRLKRSVGVAALKKLARHNVHATGVGYKMTGIKRTRTLCVQIFVHVKLPKSLIPKSAFLDAEIDGLPTDVVVLPRIYPCLPPGAGAAPADSVCREPVRPLQPGLSAAHRDIAGGTLGCFCRSTRVGDDPSAVYLLGNNHVFSVCNSGEMGDDILQPSPCHCGTPADVVAEMDRFAMLAFGQGSANEVDCGLARLATSVRYSAALPNGQRIAGVEATAKDRTVYKYGAASGYTEGRVRSTSFNYATVYSTPRGPYFARFVGQIRVQVKGSGDFSLHGDSGAVLIDKTSHKAVGLLHGSSEDGNIGVACPMQTVCDALEIELL